MTAGDTTGDPAFADLLDDLLGELLNGDEPDLAATAARHPSVATRVAEAYELACGVAGRRETRRPALLGYEIVRELGRGGMGTVYLARQQQLQRDVALKVLPHSFGLSPHSRRRFLEEARALAKVRHEHIVAIHRVVDDGEMLAFEMEFVDGPSLQSLLAHLREVRQAGAQPTLRHVADRLGLPLAALGAQNLVQYFVRIGLRIADALAAVHAAGFVHRDVKPANVLLRRGGDPVLADFGLARDAAVDLTQQGGFAGTPVYASPEQLRGDLRITAATDVYALAVTVYECLTLATPFAARTTTELLDHIQNGRVPPLRRRAPHAPRDLETILAHAMEADPDRRYADGRALADDLQRLLELQPIHARPAGLLRRAGKLIRRQRRSLIAGCVGALAVAATAWPLAGAAAARARDLAAAGELVREARAALLDPACRRPAWDRFGLAAVQEGERRHNADAIAAIDRAVAAYRAALERHPDDPVVRTELALARLLRWQRTLQLPTNAELAKAQRGAPVDADVPAIVGAAAAAVASGAGAGFDAATALASAGDAERATFAVFAFLAGELRWGELAWARGTEVVAGNPLHEAVLGLQLLADGAPERAFPHLQTAQRELPAAPLPLDIADAALAMGDAGTASLWLQRAAAAPGDDARKDLLAADLLAAHGDLERARDVYERLARTDGNDPAIHLRLVRLLALRGDGAKTAAALDRAVTRWPGLARFHFERARLALQRRDTATYCAEALSALGADLDAASAADARDYVEILRIGGLAELRRTLLADRPRLCGGPAFLGGELPLRAFLRADTVATIEALLPVFADVGRRVRAFGSRGLPLDPETLRITAGVPLAVLALAPLAQNLSLPQRLLCSALPATGRVYVPLFQLMLQRLLARLSFAGWNELNLLLVVEPADLGASHLFGNEITRGADWNGDGVDDLLVACESMAPRAARGRVLVVDGRTCAALAEVRDDGDERMFGHALAVVGDLDGDGVADWLVGAPAGVPECASGRVELFSGADRRRIAIVEQRACSFGVGVAGLGDVDGDGVPDFAVAAPPIALNATGQGQVTVYSGRTREPLRDLRNDLAGYWFGGAIAAVDDTDGDGTNDLVVGGNYGRAPGLVRLYSGRTGAVLHEFRDADAGTGFGCAVAGLGDVDGDGRGDLAISALPAEVGGLGQVWVRSGRTGALLLHLARPGADFGCCVRSYVTDGGPLLAIGARLGGSNCAGTVEILALDGRLLSTLHGPGANARFGGAFAPTTDTDGDGRPELFVGAPRTDRQGMVARVQSSQIPFHR